MFEVKFTYRIREDDESSLLWFTLNDEDELGPISLNAAQAAELAMLFNRLSDFMNAVNEAKVEEAQRHDPPRRPSHTRVVPPKKK